MLTWPLQNQRQNQHQLQRKLLLLPQNQLRSKFLEVTLQNDVTFLFGLTKVYNLPMKSTLNKIIRHPGLILSTWFVFVFFMVVILPAVSMATFEQGLTESIDTNFAFDPSLIYPIVESYGAEGRAYYILQRWTFDLIWPLVYGLPLYVTLNRFIPPSLTLRKLIVLLPLMATALDYLENIIFTLLVSLFPIEIPLLAWLGVSVSALKWLALGTSMFLVTILPGFGLYGLIRKRLKKTS